MTQTSPIVDTIEVIHQDPTGVIALVGGRRRFFPDLDTVFRAAINLLDEQTQPHVRPGPPTQRTVCQPTFLPGFAP